MAAGGEEVDVVGDDVDGDCSGGLDRVDGDQAALGVHGVGQRAERAAEAGAPLHVGDGDQAGAVADGGDDVLGGDASVGLGLHDVDFDALGAERGPGVAVGGVLGVGHDDVVAGLPGQAAGDDREAGSGVGDEADFVAAARTEQGCGVLAQGGDLVHPVGADVAGAGGLLDVGADCVGGALWQRGNSGVIEEGELVEHWEHFGRVGHRGPSLALVGECHQGYWRLGAGGGCGVPEYVF